MRIYTLLKWRLAKIKFMTLTDFIGHKIVINNKKVTILYVGIENGYVMFGYKSNGKIVTINSNTVLLKIQYLNRPKLHGETYFIGPNMITARWTDDEGLLIKKGKTQVRDASLSDIKLKSSNN